MRADTHKRASLQWLKGQAWGVCSVVYLILCRMPAFWQVFLILSSYFKRVGHPSSSPLHISCHDSNNDANSRPSWGIFYSHGDSFWFAVFGNIFRAKTSTKNPQWLHLNALENTSFTASWCVTFYSADEFFTGQDMINIMLGPKRLFPASPLLNMFNSGFK